jgi:malate synthase
LTVDGGPISASVADIGLHLMHCRRRPAYAGSATFDLPVHHHPREGQWWADVIADAHELVGLLDAGCLRPVRGSRQTGQGGQAAAS